MGLREEREAANLSQVELARLAKRHTPGVLVNQSQVSRIERGAVRRVGFDLLVALAKALRRAGRHVAPEDLRPRPLKRRRSS